MTRLDLKPLKKRGLAILRLSADDWQELLDGRKAGSRFTLVFPHDVARVAKAKSPVLVVIDGGQAYGGEWDESVAVEDQLKLGWIKSIQAVATRDSRAPWRNKRRTMPASAAIPAAGAQPPRGGSSEASATAPHKARMKGSRMAGKRRSDRFRQLNLNVPRRKPGFSGTGRAAGSRLSPGSTSART